MTDTPAPRHIQWCDDCSEYVGHVFPQTTGAYRLVDKAAAGSRDEHPGAPHEFRTVCRRCGENGYLHVSLITDGEVVRIEPRAALAGPTGADHD